VRGHLPLSAQCHSVLLCEPPKFYSYLIPVILFRSLDIHAEPLAAATAPPLIRLRLRSQS
jgi:hypothetical protein